MVRRVRTLTDADLRFQFPVLTSDLTLWLVVGGIVVAGLLGFFVYRVHPLYTRDAVVPLRHLAATHEDVHLVGWEPHVKGTWHGFTIHYRVTLDHGAAERYEYRTGETTTIDVHVPVERDSTPDLEPTISEEQLPEADAVAPSSAGEASLFAAPMGFVFEMEGTLGSADEMADLLDDLVALADRAASEA